MLKYFNGNKFAIRAIQHAQRTKKSSTGPGVHDIQFKNIYGTKFCSSVPDKTGSWLMVANWWTPGDVAAARIAFSA